MRHMRIRVAPLERREQMHQAQVEPEETLHLAQLLWWQKVAPEALLGQTFSPQPFRWREEACRSPLEPETWLDQANMADSDLELPVILHLETEETLKLATGPLGQAEHMLDLLEQDILLVEAERFVWQATLILVEQELQGA